jgi:type IV secretory pathway protease TraF
MPFLVRGMDFLLVAAAVADTTPLAQWRPSHAIPTDLSRIRESALPRLVDQHGEYAASASIRTP